MSKRKILALASAVCMVAILAIGGTLAYFTDKDEATNTFTTGGVDITLIEQERGVNKDGEKALVPYTGTKTLMPIVGAAQGEKDDFGQPVAANYIDKIVTIKNTGKSAAWVRAYFAIPSVLDDGYETFNAGLNVLHFNFGNYFTEDGTLKTTYGEQWIWKKADGKWKYYQTTIGGVAYNVYFADYYQPLAAGKTTEQFVSGVYLDANVDMNEQGQYTINRNGVTSVIEGFDGNAKCPVFAVAVQADGFDNAADAITAAYGAQYNPFGGEATNWQ